MSVTLFSNIGVKFFFLLIFFFLKLLCIEQGWAKYGWRAVFGQLIDPVWPTSYRWEPEEGGLWPVPLYSTTARASPGHTAQIPSPPPLLFPCIYPPGFWLALQQWSPGAAVADSWACIGWGMMQHAKLSHLLATMSRYHSNVTCLCWLWWGLSPGQPLPTFLVWCSGSLWWADRRDGYSVCCITPRPMWVWWLHCHDCTALTGSWEVGYGCRMGWRSRPCPALAELSGVGHSPPSSGSQGQLAGWIGSIVPPSALNSLPKLFRCPSSLNYCCLICQYKGVVCSSG